MTHYPFYAMALAKSNEYDIVLCGHTHESNVERINNTWLINPGEIMGWKGKSTIAIYNFNTDKANIINLED